MKILILFLLIISVLEISSEPDYYLLPFGIVRHVKETEKVCFATFVTPKQGFSTVPCVQGLIVKKPSGQNEYKGVVEFKHMPDPVKSLRNRVIVDVQLGTNCKSSLAVITVFDDPEPNKYVIESLDWQKEESEIPSKIAYYAFVLSRFDGFMYVRRGIQRNDVKILDLSECAAEYPSHNLENAICAKLEKYKPTTKYDIGAPLLENKKVIAILCASGQKKIRSKDQASLHRPLLFEKTAPNTGSLNKALKDGDAALAKFRAAGGLAIVTEVMKNDKEFSKKAPENIRKRPVKNGAGMKPSSSASKGPAPPQAREDSEGSEDSEK